MADIADEIASEAENAAALCEYHSGTALDYSEASLVHVEKTLADAEQWRGEFPQDRLENVIVSIGCYILEVGRREFGGRYMWHDERNQPVLVVGEPTFRVAIITQDKVRGRLGGDPADNIPFFYSGFAELARTAAPGTDALCV